MASDSGRGSRPFAIEALGRHERTSFSCGVAALDEYFRTQARQDMRRRVAACFVAIDATDGSVAGYYTLSACHLDLTDLRQDWRRRLPRYPHVPAVRLGRLGVDHRHRGRKLGAALLADAVARAVAADIAIHMMVVDAKDDRAVAFYRHHGFEQDPGERRRLFAPLLALARALES